MPSTDIPDWVTQAMAADPTRATQDLLDRIADSLRCARAEKEAWAHTAQILNEMDAADAREELKAVRAALGLAHSRAKPNYGALADAYDAHCEAESGS